MRSSKKLLVAALGIVAAASITSTAGAYITGSSGSVTRLTSAPASVRANALESATTAYAFDEQQGVKLSAPVAIDASAPGTYSSFPNGSAVIPAGTVVDSHLIHTDIPSTSTTVHFTGSVTFSGDIIGVIAATTRLVASDSALGAVGTLYGSESPWRGLEALEANDAKSRLDQFTISANHRTLSYDVRTRVFDEIRIVTKHVNGLAVSVTDSPDPVQAGQPVVYKITVTNTTGSTAPNVQVRDAFPGATFLLASPSCTAAATVTCTLGSLAPGASKSVSVAVFSPSTVPAGGTITNTATAPPGDGPGASAITTVVSPQLSTTIDDAPDPVTVGNKVHYELTVKNTGIAPVANAHVTDTLPPDTTLVSATSSGGCTGTGPVDCALGTISPGQSVTAIIIATVPGAVPAGGTITDHAIASPGTNTEGTAVTTIEAQQPGVTKGWVQPGGSLTTGGDNPATVTLPDTGPGAPVEITQGPGTFCAGTCHDPTTTISSFPADYSDANHPITVLLSYTFAGQPDSLKQAAKEFNATVYKLVTPPSTGVVVADCATQGAGVADPHPCLDNRDILNTGPNAYVVTFTLRELAGDPTHGTR